MCSSLAIGAAGGPAAHRDSSLLNQTEHGLTCDGFCRKVVKAQTGEQQAAQVGRIMDPSALEHIAVGRAGGNHTTSLRW